MRRLNWKLFGLLMPIGFLGGVLITFLPPRPGNLAYVQKHPASLAERTAVGLFGALFFPLVVASRCTKKP